MTRPIDERSPVAARRARPLVMIAAIVAALMTSACGSSPAAPRESGAGASTGDDGATDVVTSDLDGGGDADFDAGDGSGGDVESDAGDASGVDGEAGDRSDGGGPPQRLFVATYLGGLWSFVVDDLTGSLNPVAAPYDVGAQLYALAVHPSGRFAYATDLRGTLIAYAITPGTGALAHLPGSPITIGSAAIAAAIDPSGRFLYVGDEVAFHIFTIDPETGALAEISSSPVDIGGRPSTIAFHPSGRYLFASFGSIGPMAHGGIRTFVIDTSSGALTESAASPFITDNVRGGGLVLHPSGKFLYVGSFKLSGFVVDQDTGGLTALPGFPLAGGNSDSTAIDVAVDPSGQYLYATDFAGSLYGYRIDAGTGMLTAVPGSPFDARPDPYSVAIDPAGRFVYVGNDDANLLSAFRLDPATGSLAPIAGSPFTVNGLQPEIVVSGGHM